MDYGGRSECKFAGNCKKGTAFKQIKWMEKSGINHQKEVFVISLEGYDILIKNNELKNVFEENSTYAWINRLQ